MVWLMALIALPVIDYLVIRDIANEPSSHDLCSRTYTHSPDVAEIVYGDEMPR